MNIYEDKGLLLLGDFTVVRVEHIHIPSGVFSEEVSLHYEVYTHTDFEYIGDGFMAYNECNSSRADSGDLLVRCGNDDHKHLIRKLIVLHYATEVAMTERKNVTSKYKAAVRNDKVSELVALGVKEEKKKKGWFGA